MKILDPDFDKKKGETENKKDNSRNSVKLDSEMKKTKKKYC